MKIENKKFLLIGGAGFIGSHTLDLLLKEPIKELIIFDNFTRGSYKNIENALKDKRVKIYDKGGDICHKDILDDALNDIDGVFHFAALWLLHCWNFPESAFKTNIEGSFNVFNSCIKNNIERLVFSSSASVYGDALETPMTEDHPFNNNNLYGATKIAGEQLAKALHHRYGLNYVGLRYMNVYGARQDYKGAYIAVIMKILDNLDKGINPVLDGDGSQALDFVSVKDCALANVLAMKSDIQDQCYNVGTGIQTTLKELTNTIMDVYGKKMEIQYVESKRTFVKNRVGSTVKAKSEIGFDAKIKLEEGIKDLIEWRNKDKDA
jgi:UDP-glucose 4-epimerase